MDLNLKMFISYDKFRRIYKGHSIPSIGLIVSQHIGYIICYKFWSFVAHIFWSNLPKIW